MTNAHTFECLEFTLSNFKPIVHKFYSGIKNLDPLQVKVYLME